MSNVMIGSCSTAGRNLRSKSSSRAGKYLSTKCGTKTKVSKSKIEIPYRVVWYQKKDPTIKGKEYHKTRAEAVQDAKEWNSLGFVAKLEKGNFDKIYYSDRRNQI